MLTAKANYDKVFRIGGIYVIVYDGIMQKLSAAGWTSYRLRHEGMIAEGTLTRIRQGQSITTETIDRICELLNCQPGEILKWEPGK